MYRRRLIVASGALVATATAGCLGLNGQPNRPVNEIDVEVEFTIEGGDLVASHHSGDVLQGGQTVYVTVEGEKVAETTLDGDVHTGGEIIRVEEAESDYHSEKRVGLYVTRNGQSVELAAADVPFKHPTPNMVIEWDYDPNKDTVTIMPERDVVSITGRLVIKGDSITASDVTWEAPANPNGTSAVFDGTNFSGPIAIVTDLNTHDVVKLIWQTTEGDAKRTISSFEAP